CGRDPARQAPHDGVRDVRSGADAQPVESRVHAGRVVERLGRGRGRAHGAALARQPDDRLERTTGVVLRARRAEADLRQDQDAKMPASFGVVHAAAYVITRSDTASLHAERFALKADLYRPAIRSAIEMGMLIPGDLYVRALRIRSQFRREMLPLLERYDVLLTPTTPAPAPEGMPTGDPQFQIPWSLSGLPSITVPCGLSSTGLPLGIQLVSG